MVLWTKDDGTTIEWDESQVRKVASQAGGKAIEVNAVLDGVGQLLKAGDTGKLAWDHPTDYTSAARIREVVFNKSSFGGMLKAVIEFE